MIELLLPYYARIPFYCFNPGAIEFSDEAPDGVAHAVDEDQQTEAVPRQRLRIRHDGQYNVPTGLDPAIEAFMERLTETTNHHFSRKKLEAKLAACDEEIVATQKFVDANNVLIEFMNTELDEIPDFERVTDRLRRNLEDAEENRDRHERQRIVLKGDLDHTTRALSKATKRMYRHANAVLDVAYPGLTISDLEADVTQDFITQLKLAKICYAALELSEKRCSASRKTSSREQWRANMKRVKLQRAGQIQRNENFIESLAVPLLEACGGDSTSSVNSPLQLPVESPDNVLNDWESEPSVRRRVRRVRREIFRLEDRLEHLRYKYFAGVGSFFLAYPNATADMWDAEVPASSEGDGEDFEVRERRLTEVIARARSDYEHLFDAAGESELDYLPFAATEVASREGDGDSASAARAMIESLPQRLSRSGISRRVKNWLRDTPDPPESEDVHSVRPDTVMSLRSPSPSIFAESPLRRTTRRGRVERMGELRDKLRERGVHE